MAIWQYSTHLVSNEELLQNRSNLPKSITEEERERLVGWQASSSFKIVDEIVSKYLAKKKSWSNEIEQWGEEDSHCIQLYRNGGTFSEIFIRLDLRYLNKNFLDLIIKLSEELNASSLNDDGHIIELNLSNLRSEITSSDAFRFVKDPKGFLKDIAETKK